MLDSEQMHGEGVELEDYPPGMAYVTDLCRRADDCDAEQFRGAFPVLPSPDGGKENG